jgi:hypothetical protein
MQLTSRKTIYSKAIEGVRFSVRRLNRVQRARRDRSIAEQREQYFAASNAYFEAMKKAGFEIGPDGRWARKEGAPEPTLEMSNEIRSFGDQATMYFDEFIVPASIRAGLISIENLACNGESITTADQLLDCESNADDLIHEVYLACEGGAGLSDEERKNSQSLTTSGAQVEGEISDSTVSTVKS